MPRKRNTYTHRSARSGNRERKRIILVATEGQNKTESNYLRCFDDEFFTLVFVPDRSTDPVNLMKSLIAKAEEVGLTEELRDKAYCIVDADANPNKDRKIKQADNLAKKVGIASLIVSNPCFEIWFLCHHGYSSRQYYSSDEVISVLKKLYPDYNKNDEHMYSKTIDKVQHAIENAMQLEREALSLGIVKHTNQFQPSTEVYKVVIELLKS